jgi:L-threonylcarbamoyladenylate synthase
MEIISVVKDSDLKKVIDRLKSGQIGIILSDTIYGLSCIINNREAINKVYQIKKRNKNKSFIILISDFVMLKKYCWYNKEQENILKKYWLNTKKHPGTFILSPKKNIISFLNISFDKGVGVRLPKNDFLIKIIKSLDQSIISTSCNLSGQKNLNNYKDIISFFNNVSDKPDFLVKFKNIRPKRKASKIFDIRYEY